MEIKSSFYRDNISDRCMDIPFIDLQEVIDELSQNAKFFMSSDIDATTTEKINAAIVDLLKNQKYKFLPLYLVGEAFTTGSLGELGGTTRFTVRNVCIWLNAMHEKLAVINQERMAKEDAERRAASEKAFRMQKKDINLYGAAMARKMEWFQGTGPQSGADYDRCTLDKIVELIRKGYSLREINPSMIL
jgi:hypothetical protein